MKGSRKRVLLFLLAVMLLLTAAWNIVRHTVPPESLDVDRGSREAVERKVENHSQSGLVGTARHGDVAPSNIDTLIHNQLSVCSALNSSTTTIHSQLFNSSTAAWHTFIPPQSHMTQTNCWYITNMVHPSPSLEDKLTRWINLDNIDKRFSKEEASTIVNGILDSKNLTASFKTKLDMGDKNAHLFCMPKVYLLGFPKCGTTYLYNFMTGHRDIAIPQAKEGQFWRGFVATSDKLYQQLNALHYLFHFKDAAFHMRRSQKLFTIDASASTVFERGKWTGSYEKDACAIPVLMSRLLPHTKFLVAMRDPVDRLWSDFWYFCHTIKSTMKDGKVVLPDEISAHPSEAFHNRSLVVAERFQRCVKEGNSELECVAVTHGKSCEEAQIRKSLYYFHLVRWLSVIPKEQFLFLKTEELNAENMHSVMEKVWTFLDIRAMTENEFRLSKIKMNRFTKMRNENSWIKSDKNREKFKMWPKTRRLLEEFFRPYNQRLVKLLGDDRFLWGT